MRSSHLEKSVNCHTNCSSHVERPVRGAHLERLEHRRLFAAAVVDGTLVVDGTAGPDVIGLHDNDVFVYVTLNGQETAFPVEEVNEIEIYGREAGDQITYLLNRDVKVIGGAGDDAISGSAGNDTFIWNENDGNDTIDGFGGQDTFIFNATNASETIAFGNFASYLNLTRDLGSVSVAVREVENVIVNAMGGADIITVNDQRQTAVSDIRINLGADDGQVDAVTVNGTSNTDEVALSEAGGELTLAGLAASVTLINAETISDQLLYVGAAGEDTLTWNGGDAGETLAVLSNGNNVNLFRTGLPIINAGTVENFIVKGNGGNDMISGTGNLAALAKFTFDGGDGNDTVIGTNGNDTLLGSSGNDSIDGNQGNDTVFLGEDDDVVNWDPGDGSDTIDAGSGNDNAVFNGSGGNEIFALYAENEHLKLSRNIGNIVMDFNALETILVRAMGGTDTVNVGDLSTTHVTSVDIDLGPLTGGGDQQNDAITVSGSDESEQVEVAGVESLLTISGLAALVSVQNLEAARDTLTLNLHGGNDHLNATGLADSAPVNGIAVLAGPGNDTLIGGTGNNNFNGEAGDDSLVGGSGAESFFGGAGNDTVDGNAGNDIAFLDADDDTFIWNPGDGSDTVEGAAGVDTLVFNGTSTAETIALSAVAGRVSLTRNVGAVNMDLAGLDAIHINAAGGSDLLTVNDLGPTDTVMVKLDLANTPGGAAGDGATDTINVNGAAGSEFSSISGTSESLIISMAAMNVQIDHHEPGSDVINYNGGGGIDTIQFVGTENDETIDLSANGARARLTRANDLLRIDFDDTEMMTINTGDGSDVVTINSLAGTDLTSVDVRMLGVIGLDSEDDPADRVILNGTSGNNLLTISNPPAGGTQVGGFLPLLTLYADPLDSLRINTLGGMDTININQAEGTDTIRRIEMDGGAELDNLNVVRTTAEGVAVIVPSSGNDSVNISSGNNLANALLEETARVGALNIGFGGRLTIAPGGGKVLVASSLNFSGNAHRLDLADNALIIDYGGLSPYSLLHSKILSGYNSGAWNGDGIVSSVAAVDPATGIGYAEASSIFTTFPAQFRGQGVDNTAILITHTFRGDANLDGAVNTSDFNLLAMQFNQSDRRWHQGDFNYNGGVNALDFNSLATNFGKQIMLPHAAQTSATIVRTAAQVNLFADQPIAEEIDLI